MIDNSLALKLGRELKKIYDNDGFILGILTYADNPEDQQTILDFINKGEDVTDETVLVLAISLSNARN